MISSFRQRCQVMRLLLQWLLLLLLRQGVHTLKSKRNVVDCCCFWLQAALLQLRLQGMPTLKKVAAASAGDAHPEKGCCCL
jgi:hypothetical protein